MERKTHVFRRKETSSSLLASNNTILRTAESKHWRLETMMGCKWRTRQDEPYRELARRANRSRAKFSRMNRDDRLSRIRLNLVDGCSNRASGCLSASGRIPREREKWRISGGWRGRRSIGEEIERIKSVRGRRIRIAILFYDQPLLVNHEISTEFENPICFEVESKLWFYWKEYIYIYIFDLIGQRKKKSRLFIYFFNSSRKRPSHSEGESFFVINRTIVQSRWHARRKNGRRIYTRDIYPSDNNKRVWSMNVLVIPRYSKSFILRPSRTWNEALFEMRLAAMYYSFHYEFFFSNGIPCSRQWTRVIARFSFAVIIPITFIIIIIIIIVVIIGATRIPLVFVRCRR